LKLGISGIFSQEPGQLHKGQMIFSQVMNLIPWRRFPAYSNPVDKSTGVLCDQRVRLTGTNATKDYPEMIRRVRYIDKETGIL